MLFLGVRAQACRLPHPRHKHITPPE